MRIGKHAIYQLQFLSLMLLCTTTLFAAQKLRYKPGMQPLDFRRIQLPTTAPSEVKDLKSLRFPDPAVCCDLDVRNVRAGTYVGPDGAKVYVRQGGSWTWYRNDGARIWSSRKSMMRLSLRKHRVTSYRLSGRRSEFNRRSVWNFPDGTELRRFYVEKFRHYAYTFADAKKGLFYRLIEKGSFLPSVKRRGIFEFHFKPGYEHFVDAFYESPQRKKLLRLLRKDLNSWNRGRIPVLLFETLDEYDGYLQERRRPHPGGRGKNDVLILCCAKKYGSAPNTKDEMRRYRSRHEYNLMLHELAHNLMWHGCYASPNFDPAKRKFPGRVYSEGMAEWVAATINPRYRRYLYRAYYRYMDAGQLPSFSKLPNSGRLRSYTTMMMVWQYAEEKYGRKSLLDFHKASCSGRNPDAAAKVSTGQSLERLYKNSIRFFRQRRKYYNQ